MSRCQRNQVVTLLLMVTALQGCGSYLTVASRTIETTSAAVESAARAGEAFHRAEVEKLTVDLTAEREALGCGSGESLPAGCDKIAWADTREAFKAKMAKAKDRYSKFKAAITTTDGAVALAADAFLAVEENKDGPDLAALLARLVSAYRSVAVILKAWDVEVPGGV